MSREFYEARRLFINHINYTNPYSYEEWIALPDDHKTVALYIQYFNEIILAWYKTKSFYASEEEGVETVLQYLNKNVPILEANEKKFNERYIYRVAYNCLYCISHDRICDKWEYQNVRSSIHINPQTGTEFDLFDIIKDKNVDKPYAEQIRRQFWAEVEDLGEGTEYFVQHVLEGQGMPVGFRGKRKKEKIIEEVKPILEKYKSIYY